MDVNVVSLPSSVPWAAIIGAVTALVVLIATLRFNYVSNAQRLEHERTLKLREDRLKAYATMARVTKAIVASPPNEDTDLGEAHAEIELVTDDQELVNIGSELVKASASARQVLWELEKLNTQDPWQEPKMRVAKQRLEKERAQFIERAKKDLGPIPSRSS
jgi:hypothetical protein